MHARRLAYPLRFGAAGLAGFLGLLTVAQPAFGAGQFTTGDLVIDEALGTSSSSTAISLVDYSTSGVPSGFAVNLPTTASGGNFPLTDSGKALNDGELSNSADGQSIIVTGYDEGTGSSSVTSSSVPRTVGIVTSSGTVDTTTALADTNEGNNFRSAISSTYPPGNIYTAGKAGLGFTTDGGTSDTFLDSTDSVDDLQIYNGQLYMSDGSNIYQVGTGLPTSGTPTLTPLLTGANLPAHFGPAQFAFTTLGSTPGPNTLYVADGSNGATSGDPNAVEKYSLESGVWTATGSVTVPQAIGLAIKLVGGTVDIYATGALTDTSGNNTVLYGFSDTSGFGGTLTGSATSLATAPSGDDFHGLAWAPPAPAAESPEVPLALALPVVAGVLLGGAYLLVGRRRRAAA
jgi:hypothetical protein